MERREAVKYISILLGGTVIGADAFITGCKSKTGNIHEWTGDDIAYLNEIADTILPTTKTPGAKAANVGQFMTVMVNDCYEEKDQKTFKDGMDKINELSKKDYSKNRNLFSRLTFHFSRLYSCAAKIGIELSYTSFFVLLILNKLLNME